MILLDTINMVIKKYKARDQKINKYIDKIK